MASNLVYFRYDKGKGNLNMDARTMYNTHEARLNKMTKKAIIAEGVENGFWADYPSTIASLLKQKKFYLVHRVANCHTMQHFRGYF